jgi:hypothetical protein
VYGSVVGYDVVWLLVTVLYCRTYRVVFRNNYVPINYMHNNYPLMTAIGRNLMHLFDMPAS